MNSNSYLWSSSSSSFSPSNGSASPNGTPKSDTAKVFTILYGALGIPLAFCTLSLTGLRLTLPAMNLARIVRHYCVSLPAYYLCCCCSCCDFYGLLRILSWCCCCCCCSYFCCPDSKSRSRATARHRAAPKLILVKDYLPAQAAGGAPRAAGKAARPSVATPFVINAHTEPAGKCIASRLARVRPSGTPERHHANLSLSPPQDPNSSSLSGSTPPQPTAPRQPATARKRARRRRSRWPCLLQA